MFIDKVVVTEDATKRVHLHHLGTISQHLAEVIVASCDQEHNHGPSDDSGLMFHGFLLDILFQVFGTPLEFFAHIHAHSHAFTTHLS